MFEQGPCSPMADACFHPATSRRVLHFPPYVKGRFTSIEGGAMIQQDILDLFRLKPGKKVRLKDHDTGWAQTKELKELGKGAVKDRAREVLDKNLEDLAEAQELLYAV